ncbi:MAG: PhzF family phenazine biosynthesis protein [Hyphomonadaceae bacterium]
MRAGSRKFDLALNEAEMTIEAKQQGGRWSAKLTSPRIRSRQVSSSLAGEFLREFEFTTADLVEGFPPMLANAGATHLVFALRDRQKLKAMTYKLEPMKTPMRASDVVTVSLSVNSGDGKIGHSRNAFVSDGVYEDPTTAMAAALGGLMREGDDMNFPCRIKLKVEPQRGTPVGVPNRTKDRDATGRSPPTWLKQGC